MLNQNKLNKLAKLKLARKILLKKPQIKTSTNKTYTRHLLKPKPTI
jgi:hypothetical protein